MRRCRFFACSLIAVSFCACGGEEAGTSPAQVNAGSPTTSVAPAATSGTPTGNGSAPRPMPQPGDTSGGSGSVTSMPAGPPSPTQPGATTTEPTDPPTPDTTAPEPTMSPGAGGAPIAPTDAPTQEPVSGGSGGTPTTPSAGGAGGMMGDIGSGGTPTTPSAGGAGGMMGASDSMGGSALDPSVVIIQDDFDSATGFPDPALWEEYEQWAQDQGIAPVIDTAKARSAPNSVRVTSSNVGLGSFLVPVSGFPVSDNSFYVRVYINWEKATSTITGHSGFLVGATARDNSGTEVRLGISDKGPGDQAMLDLNLIGGGGGEVTRYSNGFTDGGNPGDFSGNGFQFAADTWYCLEAYFGGGVAAEFRVWVDDTEVADMHVTDFQGSAGGEPRTDWAPSYTVLKIGAQDYDANLGSIWYDDVIIATERVGCF